MTTGERVEVYQDEAGEWRWSRIAANNERLSASTEGYKNKGHALEQAYTLNVGVPVMEVPKPYE